MKPPRPVWRSQEPTITRVFQDSVLRRADEVALRQKVLGIWRAVTWRELGATVREIAMGLAALGLAPGETVSILSNTTREWLYADMGALCAGAVSSGIYPTCSADQVGFLLDESRSAIAFVEDEEQLDKVLIVRDRLPLLRRIVVFDMEGLHQFNDPMVVSLAALMSSGRVHDAAQPGLWESRLHSRAPDDLAILIFTSGTTGRPRGAMISHRNVMATLAAYQSVLAQDERDERMCFLPLCHAVERIGGAYLALFTGARLNFVENMDTVAENVREISPTVLLAVPRIWEKFHSGVTLAIRDAPWFDQWAYRHAIALGQRVARRRESWQPVPPVWRFLFWLARLLVLDNIRRAIGVHRARLLVTGAAPTSPDLIRWYMALGLDMIEMWGQTEASGVVTANPPGRVRPGTIGTPVAGVEVSLSAEGELLVRGEIVFMGYVGHPEQTGMAIREGWLHTGDVGARDECGYYRIIDRIKDIIITAGGKNITPSEIENQIKFSPYVTDAIVIGDRRPFLTALVMIDQENVEQYAQNHAIPFSDFASLCRRSEIRELIAAEIERVNRAFARVEQVKDFRLIENRLTAEDEELTPTMKLKRVLVARKYVELIEQMYA